MSQRSELARFSKPPPIGDRVRILIPGWGYGKTGVVSEHSALDEYARCESGRVVGHSFTVLLDEQKQTRWGQGHEIKDFDALYSWEVEPCET